MATSKACSSVIKMEWDVSGTVDSQQQRNRAGKLAIKVRGVKNVVNNIIVKGPPAVARQESGGSTPSGTSLTSEINRVKSIAE